MNTKQYKVVTNGDMSGDVTSKVIDLGDVQLGSIQNVFTGVPVGSLFLEISNDIIDPSTDPNVGVTNWDSYGAVHSIVAASSHTFNISNMGYKWLRVRFTQSGGSAGVLNSTVAAKND